GSGESVWDIKARFGVVSNDLHNRYVKGWRVLDVVVSGFFDSLGLYDDSGASESSTAKQWLQVLGLGHLAREYYHELSFGEQRLVLLARAMVKQPLILILDEPVVGLDDQYSALLLAMVDRIAAAGQTQIVFVSHSLDDTPSCINVRVIFERAAAESRARSTVRVLRADSTTAPR
ncbi:MAG TPA: ATP-binding cassette domain-containing protein, partial [Pseudohongiella sp.]|nr:ATP-binding cassette domain-containing protein [Pseudohongiella sp.]